MRITHPRNQPSVIHATARLFCCVAASLLTSCTAVPNQQHDEPGKHADARSGKALNCRVSIYQDGVAIAAVAAAVLPGAPLYQLENRPFVIRVADAGCAPSLGRFAVFEKMRWIGASKRRIFTTTGFEMAGSASGRDTLPTARDAQQFTGADLNGLLGAEGMENYARTCKEDGVCPLVLAAFRSYWAFTKGSENEPTFQAEIRRSDITRPAGFSSTVALMVYTELKRMPHRASNGNWPADILLEAHPLFLLFKASGNPNAKSEN